MLHRLPRSLALAVAAPCLAGVLHAESPEAFSVAAPAARGLATALEVHAATIQHFTLPTTLESTVSIPVVLDGESYTLDMAPYSVRSEKFEVLVQGEDGELVPYEVSAPTTVRGVVRGVPGSIVSGNLVDGSLTATVGLHADDSLWGIQPRADVDVNAPASEHVVYASTDRIGGDHSCGNDLLEHAEIRKSAPSAPSYSGGGFVVCEIGIDTDVQYYALNGSSVDATENDIESIINSTDAIYSLGSQIRYEITTIIVRTAEPDPYSSTTNPSSLLGEFDFHWTFNQGSVQRDIAHLFTGRDIDGGVIGIAKLSTICSQTQGYGLSQSRFSNNFTSRVALTAHELGHNWSAQHCNSTSDCRIMCSGLGGCTGVVTSFGPVSLNSISNEKNSSGCLGNGNPPGPPTISNVSPDTKSLYGPSITKISIIGQNMTFATSVTIDGTVFTDGQFDVVTNARIEVAPPAPTSLGPVDVTVSSPFGNSSDSFEWVSPETIITAPSFAFSGFDLDWVYGGPANNTAFLVISLSPAVAPVLGFDIFTSPIVIATDTLDDFGLGDFAITIPASATGVIFYSQLVTFDTAVTGASNVTETTVLF